MRSLLFALSFLPDTLLRTEQAAGVVGGFASLLRRHWRRHRGGGWRRSSGSGRLAWNGSHGCGGLETTLAGSAIQLLRDLGLPRLQPRQELRWLSRDLAMAQSGPQPTQRFRPAEPFQCDA